jgi:heptose III glucuronosyltransferase
MHTKPIQVSVIVPAYNAAEHLQHCLDSLLEQTAEGLEIIVIDDGSSDATPAILRDYVARSSHIRVFRQINSGVSIARNNGLAHARGEFVAFMDADDYAEPTLYADMLSRARQDHLDIVLCNAWIHCSNGTLKPLFTAISGNRLQRVTDGQQWIVRSVATQQMRHYIWCHLYRRAFVLKHKLQFAPGITHQDIVWTNAAMLAARRVAMVDHPLYHYIKRAGSLSKPVTSLGQLMAARHYMRVVSLLEGLTCALAPRTAILLALESQILDEGIVVFQLARHLPFALRHSLFTELRATAHFEALARHASTLRQKRRLWKNALRYNLFCAVTRVKQSLGAIVFWLNAEAARKH